MSFTPKLAGLAVVFSAVIMAPPAMAADPGGGGCASCNLLNEKALSLDLAEAIAMAALTKCRADGNHVSVTVLDRDGLAKIAFRDDGAGPHTIVTSRAKGIHLGHVPAAFGAMGAPGADRAGCSGSEGHCGDYCARRRRADQSRE